MTINKHIKELIQSSDLDCIKLGLVYLKQDLDKCDESDTDANYLRNYYHHTIKRIRIHDDSVLNWVKPRFYLNKSQLIHYIHFKFNQTI